MLRYSSGIGYQQNEHCTFNVNPMEKWVEAIEENKRLYEARLKDKDDMIATLQKLLDKR